MPGLKNLVDLLGCLRHFGSISHREEYLLHRSSPSEVLGHCVGNQNGIFRDFRLAKRLHPFFESANDREWKIADLNHLSDGGIFTAVKTARELLRRERNLGARHRFLVIEEAAGQDQ